MHYFSARFCCLVTLNFSTFLHSCKKCMFHYAQLEVSFENNKSLYFHSEKKPINGRFIYLSSFISESGTRTQGNSLHYFKTNYHFGNFISLSRQPHILANEASLSHKWIVNLYGNKTSLYLDVFFNAWNCSLNPLINVFIWLF